MSARLRPRLIATALALAVAATLGITAMVLYSAMELARFEQTQTRRAVFIQAAGQVLAPGVSVRAIDLAGTLARLGYVEARTPPAAPGQFRRAGGSWEIVLREDRARIRLDVRDERIARVTRNGVNADTAALEGLVLAGGADQPREDYRPITLADVPPVLVNAVLAAEDHRFFQHSGLDLRGLARAVWVNVRAGKVADGGSTITQQLVKNRLLTPERSLIRKLREAWLASVIEWRYTKAQILEAYLNEIYLGQRGTLPVRGVGAAARAPRTGARRPQARARPARPVLHGPCAPGSGGALRRGDSHREHARSGAPALRRDRGGKRPGPAREPLPPAPARRAARATSGGARRHRSRQRRDPRLRRRAQLRVEPVRPGDA